MKTQSLIKALTNANIGVIRIINSNQYVAKGEKYICSWYDQDGDADCVNIRRHNDNHDSQSDYCAGFFVNTIKSAVEWTKEV